MRGAGWADLRRLTPVFDAAVVGGFTVRRDHATNRQYAAQSAQNQTYQPTCDRKLGFVPLAVTPLLLLVCFRGFQFVQIVAGTHTFDATCPGIVECGDEVDVLVRAQVTDGEMQRAVRVARRLRCGLSVQPCPRIVGTYAFGEAHGAGDFASRHLVVFGEHLPHEIRHVTMLRAHVMKRHGHVEFETALFDGGGNVPADFDLFVIVRTVGVKPAGGRVEWFRIVGADCGVGDIPMSGIFRFPFTVGYIARQLRRNLRVLLAGGRVRHGDVGDVRQILVAQFERQIQLLPRFRVAVIILASLQLVVQMFRETDVAVALQLRVKIDGTVA